MLIPRPSEGSRKKIVCNENVYEIGHTETRFKDFLNSFLSQLLLSRLVFLEEKQLCRRKSRSQSIIQLGIFSFIKFQSE